MHTFQVPRERSKENDVYRVYNESLFGLLSLRLFSYGKVYFPHAKEQRANITPESKYNTKGSTDEFL